MENAVTERAPMHLWIVGGLAAVWNGFGSCDYTMTRMHNDGWITTMMPGTDPQAIYSYVEGFPIWASFGWGLGVWMGLLGSILLLMRNRWSVPAFGLSLIGAILGLGYQIASPANLPDMDKGINPYFPYIIIAIALGLFLYARAMNRKGLLN